MTFHVVCRGCFIKGFHAAIRGEIVGHVKLWAAKGGLWPTKERWRKRHSTARYCSASCQHVQGRNPHDCTLVGDDVKREVSRGEMNNPEGTLRKYVRTYVLYVRTSTVPGTFALYVHTYYRRFGGSRSLHILLADWLTHSDTHLRLSNIQAPTRLA